MNLVIFSDPHLGTNLSANTTPASRMRLQEHLYSTAKSITDKHTSDDDTLLCGGDLVDRYSNNEKVLLQALDIAKGCDFVLSGNHDVNNNRSAVGTLDAIAEIIPEKIVCTEFGKTYFAALADDDIQVILIPHHTTQELFDNAVVKAAEVLEADKFGVVVMHCNYESGFAKDETSLNLTRKQAQKLVKAGADYVVLGHDHSFKTDLNGRVIVVGNTHPTGFSDISDKYYVKINSNGVETIPLWSKAKHYIEVDYKSVDKVDPEVHQFVKLVGEIQPSELQGLSKEIKKLWSAPDCNILAIRSEVKLVTGDVFAGRLKKSEEKTVSLVDLIEEELKDNKEMLGLWKEVTA